MGKAVPSSRGSQGTGEQQRHKDSRQQVGQDHLGLGVAVPELLGAHQSGVQRLLQLVLVDQFGICHPPGLWIYTGQHVQIQVVVPRQAGSGQALAAVNIEPWASNWMVTACPITPSPAPCG